MAFYRLCNLLKDIQAGKIQMTWIRYRAQVEHALNTGRISATEHEFLIKKMGA